MRCADQRFFFAASLDRRFHVVQGYGMAWEEKEEEKKKSWDDLHKRNKYYRALEVPLPQHCSTAADTVVPRLPWITASLTTNTTL